MPSPSKIRLGTASPASQPTVAETLSQLSALARRAASQEIDILVLPEAYLGGYPRGTAFGCVVGGRSDEGRDEYLAYFRGAVDLGDEVGEGGAGAGEGWVRREKEEANEVRGDGTREELERIARETGVFLVVGCIERAGGSLYCAVVYVDPKKGCVGKRRKVMPTATERLIWAQGSPATLKAVSTVIRGVRINLAAAICWENYMPLLRQALYAQNINLYLAPTADGRDAWLSLMRTVGIEGRCFVVSSNMCVRDRQSSESDGNNVPVNGSGHQQEDGDEVVPTQDNTNRRRQSCVTEEGFEIALPSPSLKKTKSRRRQSVFDEEGNEIVLCSKDEAIVEEGSSGNRFTNPFTTTREEMIKQVRTQAKEQTTTNGSAANFVSRGGSSIVSPFGDVLAGPQWEDDDGIIYADVDFDDCVRGRLDLDVAGSYSRNDSFRFSVQGLDLTPLSY
ncbi:Carbon-nitrogen hydrolase [Coniochaeta hoffmannii]|uniref:Carbon-nitrogen hydrolase n=1 Tax=Coniochaeta hoffmannii TaxID=91930 RepID=A0AA38VN63_9PEZI|nr:Carbon-nitrogen hydrolase [Coniochaeta hoffmannii]